MLERPEQGSRWLLALTLMTWLARATLWLARRRRASPPSPEQRSWVHPSELPSFETLAEARKEVRSRAAHAAGTLLLVALLIGGAALASTRGSKPVNGAMPAHVASKIAALPSEARAAASHIVDLTISTPGHLTSVAAMVLPHNLAVTTAPIARKAILTGSIPGHLNFPVTWIGRDKTMGFTILHLGIPVAPLTLAPLPASTSVVAVSPVMTGSVTPPRFAWAQTTLGDPTLKANGVVSYLATESNWNLNGFVDAVAVNATGQVVAVLSINHQWFAAQFVAHVAYVLATGNGCHAALGVRGTSYQGGGVLISSVKKKSAAAGLLRPGDVLISLNAQDTDSLQTLKTILYLTPAWSQSRIVFVRNTTTHHAEVVLSCGP